MKSGKTWGFWLKRRRQTTTTTRANNNNNNKRQNREQKEKPGAFGWRSGAWSEPHLGSASSTPLGQTDPFYRIVNFVNFSQSKRSFLSNCQISCFSVQCFAFLLSYIKILFIKLSNFLFFGAMLCFLCDMGSIIKDHFSLSYLCQFQVIDDESWFGPKMHCGDRMLGNLILQSWNLSMPSLPAAL